MGMGQNSLQQKKKRMNEWWMRKGKNPIRFKFPTTSGRCSRTLFGLPARNLYAILYPGWDILANILEYSLKTAARAYKGKRIDGIEETNISEYSLKTAARAYKGKREGKEGRDGWMGMDGWIGQHVNIQLIIGCALGHNARDENVIVDDVIEGKLMGMRLTTYDWSDNAIGERVATG
ncbi:hypothetical protein PRIPAC_90146 [Pristionchus pacificus]|uniref:Uncharacterized protein n=1 Tax=Pristionchus pacificus TaxID=54126 RepID=A0A2A6CXD8_PRIPA|nr:hypothetical protein PRIPAC_90146 [Pristionchus pacificus]|eukprot:PDM82798.1 hypothetical protein PRIPAC_37191 [Pristionchus pacificus]